MLSLSSQWFRFDDPKLPTVGGVYRVTNHLKQVIYVGRTDDLCRRIAEHVANEFHCMHRYGPRFILFEHYSTQQERIAREKQLIETIKPPCNLV